MASVSKKKNVKNIKKQFREYRFAILGVGLGLTIVSIVYSTVIIFTGTQTIGPKIWVLPQALFALVVTGAAFFKIFK